MDRRNFVRICGAAPLVLAAPATGFGRAPGESAREFDGRMAWWREARFGMFIHWGVYSVPAGEWKGRKVKTYPAEWIMFARQIKKREYQKLAQKFNPVQFNAAEWARIAKDAGMKYMVITSKHHDGFCMYHSELTDYNMVDATPFGRDVIAELSEACAGEGVRFGLYYSELDWRWCSYPYFLYHVPRFEQYMDYMKGQVKEILTGYGPICSLFFDGDWMPQWNDRRGTEVEALCRDLQSEVVINDRLSKRKYIDQFLFLLGKKHELGEPEVGDYATPEQFIPAGVPGADWETCMTMNDSWGYRSWDHNWKSSARLIRMLVEIASKGGNFLLNVGPDARGRIPEASVARLAAVGEWMDLNGEAIYGTQAGPLQDLSWGRTTQKENTVYLHVFDWPEGEIQVDGLAVERACLLAEPGTGLPLRKAGNTTFIKVAEKPLHPAATVIALKKA